MFTLKLLRKSVCCIGSSTSNFPFTSAVRRSSNSQTPTKPICNYEDTLLYDFETNHAPQPVHAIWLRHHCQCDRCFNKKTFQRTRIPSDLPSVSTVVKSHLEGNTLRVCWNDGHESTFNISWLKKYAPQPANELQRVQRFALQHKHEDFARNYLENFNAKQMFTRTEKQHGNPIESAISFADFMKDGDEGVCHLLSNILQHGYGIVKECPADFETTKKVIAKVSHPQNTIFGDYSEWTSNLAHADTAYTTDFVHLHTDTSYFTEPVGLQIFHCLKHDGSGGINFLADGFKIAEEIAMNNFEYYKIMASVNIPSQYIDTGKHHFYSNSVTLGHDWLSGRIHKIRYNPHDMAVLKAIPFHNVAKFYESLIHFSDLLESNPYQIKLVPGIVIFLDNWRILHGRSAFTGFRHLCGAYISRSDWLSRARTVGLLAE